MVMVMVMVRWWLCIYDGGGGGGGGDNDDDDKRDDNADIHCTECNKQDVITHALQATSGVAGPVQRSWMHELHSIQPHTNYIASSSIQPRYSESSQSALARS